MAPGTFSSKDSQPSFPQFHRVEEDKTRSPGMGLLHRRKQPKKIHGTGLGLMGQTSPIPDEYENSPATQIQYKKSSYENRFDVLFDKLALSYERTSPKLQRGSGPKSRGATWNRF
ncbi:hypothetical protein MMC15_001098 [Xylographa vitiligo]|nr:hypothetical protein [Xylographa vitiligo]